MTARAVRVGLVSVVLVTGYWLASGAWLTDQDCTASSTDPYPCLGGEVLAVAAGIPLLLVLVGLALRGRGFVHAALGALVSVGLGTIVVYAVLGAVNYSGDDTVGWALTGPAVGLVAAVWSISAPGG